MSTRETESPIDELTALRWQRHLWYAGTALCVVCILLTSLSILRSTAVGLLEAGPTHDEFVAELNHAITKEIVSRRDRVAAPTPIQTVLLPKSIQPIDQDRNPVRDNGPQAIGEPAEEIGSPSGATGCSEADAIPPDVQERRLRSLTRFRQQTVGEYQDTVKKIIDDLAAIHQAEGGNPGGGLPANTVAILLVSRVQTGVQGPSVEHHGGLASRVASENTE